MTIALLPDVLLDVITARIDPSTREKVCVVGGRAARTASVLLHLLHDDDGTFRVHLITKTGNLGCQLLENEFHMTQSDRGFRSLWKPLLRPRVGEPRCAVFDRTKPKKPINPVEAVSEEEITSSDLLTYSISRVMRQARTLYLSYIKTKDRKDYFTNLLNTILGVCKDQSLFLDADRVSNEHLKTLLAAFSPENPSNAKFRGLFLPEDRVKDTYPILAVSDVAGLARRLGINIFSYRDDACSVTFPDRTSITYDLSALSMNFKEEGVPEAFKAGVLLADTLVRALDDVKTTHPNLVAQMQAQWQGEEWKTILAYGAQLAKTKLMSHQAITLEYLVNQRNGSDHWPLTEMSSEIDQIRKPSDNKVLVTENNMRLYSRIAGFRRRDHMRCPTLPLCLQSKEGCGELCPKKKAPSGSTFAAVLFDLDGTLLDSGAQRNQCLSKALAVLEERDPALLGLAPSMAERIQKFSDNVYDYWAVFKYLQLGDFRQQWNHSGWYVTYILFAKQPSLLEHFQNTCKSICKQQSPVPSDTIFEQLLGSATWKGEFLASYSDIDRQYNEHIKAAQKAFLDYHMSPLKEARDLLRSLTATGAFNLYILSEGHPDTQWLKIKNLGLDDFFDRQHVLTTGDAATPTDERRDLELERAMLKEQLKQIKSDTQRIQSWNSGLALLQLRLRAELQDFGADAVSKEIKVWEDSNVIEMRLLKQRDALNIEQQKVADFVQWVLDRLAYKGGLSFYAAALRAILRKPHRPLDELRAFRHLLDQSTPRTKIKFAMVGDRQDNDIEPPTILLGQDHLLTIRLLSGKYAKKEIETAPDNAPLYTLSTLAQAKCVLLSQEAWQTIHCSNDPTIFNWTIVYDPKTEPFIIRKPDDPSPSVSCTLLRCGIEMPSTFRLIRRVCAGVLAEGLSKLDKANRMNILRPYLEPSAQRINEDAIVRVRALSALVLSGSLLATPMQEHALDITNRLGLDLNLLKNTSSDDLRLAYQALVWISSDTEQPDIQALARSFVLMNV